MVKSMQLLVGDNLTSDQTVFLVGLGNWRATPDSLGPKFIEYSPITRHYHQYAPQALVEGMRPTCGIAPGVLGITGLETFEVIKGVVDSVKPALLVVVDALAAQNVERIGTTIQMSNTGIQPGSGIGNARHAITQEGLGVPVIAIGCPTIVNAAIIADQAVRRYCLDYGLTYDDLRSRNSIQEIVSFYGGSLGVTPKEIDEIIENSARIIAMGVGSSCLLYTSRLWEEKLITSQETERLVSFTNNSSPLFIIGAIGVGMLASPQFGYLLAVSHYAANLIVGFIWGRMSSPTTALTNITPVQVLHLSLIHI